MLVGSNVVGLLVYIASVVLVGDCMLSVVVWSWFVVLCCVRGRGVCGLRGKAPRVTSGAGSVGGSGVGGVGVRFA